MDTIEQRSKFKTFFRGFAFTGTGIALILAVVVLFLPKPHEATSAKASQLNELDVSTIHLKAEGCTATLPDGRALKDIEPGADGKLFIPKGTTVSSECFAHKET